MAYNRLRLETLQEGVRENQSSLGGYCRHVGGCTRPDDGDGRPGGGSSLSLRIGIIKAGREGPTMASTTPSKTPGLTPGTMSVQSGALIYADVPPYDRLTKVLMVGVPSAFLIAGAVLLFLHLRLALAMLVDLVVFTLVLHFALPRRYELYTTRLRIVMGWPLRWNIPLSTIAKVRPAPDYTRFLYWGVRLATSSKTLVEIVRRKHMNVILSPSDRGEFLAKLDRALETQPH